MPAAEEASQGEYFGRRCRRYTFVVVAALTFLLSPPLHQILHRIPMLSMIRLSLLLLLLLPKSDQQKVSIIESSYIGSPAFPRPTMNSLVFCFGMASKQHCRLLARLSLSVSRTLLLFVRVWRANDIVVCSPACPRPTHEPFCFFVRVRRANDIVVCSPACPRPTHEPFCFFVRVGEQTTLSFARPPVLVRPTNPFVFLFGFGEQTTLSFARPPVLVRQSNLLCFFVWVKPWSPTFFLLVVATLTNLIFPPFSDLLYPT